MQKTLLFSLILALVANIAFAQNYSGGSGTDEDPFQISNLEDLRYLSQGHEEDMRSYYILTNDINAAETRNWDTIYSKHNAPIRQGFVPIGGNGLYGYPFSGTFDGMGHIIDSLFIMYMYPSNEALYLGLFTQISGVIKNLGLTNCDIIADDCFSNWGTYIGGILGSSEGANIANCYVTGSFNVNNLESIYLGGLIGNSHNGSIKNCWTNVGILYESEYPVVNRIGGLIGCNNATIESCNSRSKISVAGKHETFCQCGGFVGENFGEISESYATTNIITTTGNTTFIGGFSGYNYTEGLLRNCYAHGKITIDTSTDGFKYTGGFSGVNNDGIIENCFTTINITYTKEETPKNIGFVGSADSLSIFSNNFFDTEATVQDSSYGAIGKTTSEMKQQATFTDWDFENIWNIDGTTNEGYPFLRGMSVVAVEEEIPHLADGSLQLYPNPTNSLLYVNYEGNIKNIKIYDITARLIFTTNDRLIDVSILSHGCYFLVLETEDTVITKSFIKE